jgi:site-specific DNA-cytosine methylase
MGPNARSGEPPRALELFCGIGGFAVAGRDRVRITLALDVDRGALEVYRANFPTHPLRAALLESVRPEDLPEAELWWASPPCQPFTSRGRRRDLDDPRTAGLVALLGLIEARRPPRFALENVPGFAGSRAHDALRETLDRAGYEVAEHLLCPTDLGWPGRRPRWYCLASQDPFGNPGPAKREPAPALAALLEADAPHLLVAPEIVERFHSAMRVVDRSDPAATVPTFTSGYATSPVQAGGFLATAAGPRRFSPDEVLRILGFPGSFRFPAELGVERRWRLAGNSLAVPAVAWCLDRLLAATPT